MIDFEKYIVKFTKCNNVGYEWQPLKFGYKRAVVRCDSWDEFDYLRNALAKRKQIHIESWYCNGGGFFEGNVYIMAQEDYEGLNAAQKEEQQRLENWWQRYHNADAETRRLMACGKIA